MKSNKWTTLSSETSPSWIFKQHSPRQQCWRSSSCGLQCLQYLPDGSMSYKISYTDQCRPLPQRRRKNKADENTITKMYKASMRITSTKWQHLQQLKKVLPKDYHHFYDALLHGDCIETEHRNLVSSDSKAGTPGRQTNMLSSLRIRNFMVLSYD